MLCQKDCATIATFNVIITSCLVYVRSLSEKVYANVSTTKTNIDPTVAILTHPFEKNFNVQLSMMLEILTLHWCPYIGCQNKVQAMVILAFFFSEGGLWGGAGGGVGSVLTPPLRHQRPPTLILKTLQQPATPIQQERKIFSLDAMFAKWLTIR